MSSKLRRFLQKFVDICLKFVNIKNKRQTSQINVKHSAFKLLN